MVLKLVDKFLPKNAQSKSFVQIIAIFAVSLGGFSADCFYTWPSPSIPQLLSNTSYIGQITIEETSYFFIILSIFMILSSLALFPVMKIVGRKPIVGFLVIVQAVAWILIGTAKSIVSIYIGRALAGVGDSIVFFTIPIYITEISTPSVRSKWGNMLACALYFGSFAISAVGAYCHIRTTAFIFLSVPLIQILLITFIPESPYFLIIANKHNEARRALKQLRWQDNVEDEFNVITQNIQEELSKPSNFKDLFLESPNRKALMICFGLCIFQSFSGFPAFLVYIQYMFQLADVKYLSPELSSIIFFGCMFIFSVIGSSVIDKYGRRIMLVFSSIGCTIALLIEFIYFYLDSDTNVDLSKFNWVPLFGMVLYVIFFTSGLAILPIIMTAELFAVSVKLYAMLIMNILSSLTLTVVPKLFQVLFSSFPLYLPFLIFALSCFMSIIFCYYCVPETKGKTLEEIHIQLALK